MTFAQIAFSFKGRIGRKEYWIGYVILFIGFAISGAMMDSYDTEGLGIILTFALIWPGLAISVKRWHDRDKSGWWVLIKIYLGLDLYGHLSNKVFYLGRTTQTGLVAVSKQTPMSLIQVQQRRIQKTSSNIYTEI